MQLFHFKLWFGDGKPGQRVFVTSLMQLQHYSVYFEDGAGAMCWPAQFGLPDALFMQTTMIRQTLNGMIWMLGFKELKYLATYSRIAALTPAFRWYLYKFACLCLSLGFGDDENASLAEESLGFGEAPSLEVPKVESKSSQDHRLLKSSTKDVSLDPLSSIAKILAPTDNGDPILPCGSTLSRLAQKVEEMEDEMAWYCKQILFCEIMLDGRTDNNRFWLREH